MTVIYATTKDDLRHIIAVVREDQIDVEAWAQKREECFRKLGIKAITWDKIG